MTIRTHFAFLTAFDASLVDVMREKNVIVEIAVEVLINMLTFESCFIFRKKNDQDFFERKRNGLIISGHAFAHSLHSDVIKCQNGLKSFTSSSLSVQLQGLV